MDRVHPVAWEATRLTDESISLLLLNPPYDWDRAVKEGEKSRRLEYTFLHATTSKLVRGLGLLAYIIPQNILAREDVARHLVGHYDDKRVVRFPDGEYERFKQVIVFGRRRQAYNAPSGDEVAAVQSLAERQLPPLRTLDTPLYAVIPAPSKGKNDWNIRFSPALRCAQRRGR